MWAGTLTITVEEFMRCANEELYTTPRAESLLSRINTIQRPAYGEYASFVCELRCAGAVVDYGRRWTCDNRAPTLTCTTR
jgi:hypothetical protein